MKTDLPLKRLTHLCPNDLLALIGETNAEVVAVESLELPASKTSLDTVLQLRSGTGQTHLHLIEWQGWNDPLLLWRTLGYVAWLGQHRDERPIFVTVIYLKPEDDTGDTLDQSLDGVDGWSVRLPCVRLWQQDAAAAIASGLPGLLALAPLMAGATGEMVEAAAQQIMRNVEPRVQDDLLMALGVFAEPLFAAERFARLVTKERLMATDLVSYLFQDKLAEVEAAFKQEKTELEQEKTELEQEKTELEQRFQHTLQQVVEDALFARYPTVPTQLVLLIRQITDPTTLQNLYRSILVASDSAEFERLIHAALPVAPD